MARIEFNSSNDKGSYQPLPDGVYDLQIGEATQTTSGKGNPQLQVKCEVASGDYSGKKVTLFLSLLEQAGWRMKEFLEASGIDYDVSPDGKQFGFDDEDLVGCYVQAECSSREYNGSTRNDWGKFVESKLGAPAASTPTPTTPAAQPQTQAQPEASAGGMQRRSRRVP